MTIKIAGFQLNSFIDYPGKIAAIIFLGGCNFVCYYCHNNHILCGSSNKIEFAEVLEKLGEQVGFLDGVVISGGEPTLHPHLVEIVTQIKGLGFLVKLDTNGTDSATLMDLVEKGLVDYVAMDIKAPLDKYPDIVGTSVDVAEIQKSIDFLKSGKVDYMFRTTLVPVLTERDVLNIGKLINGAEVLQLQQFVPNDFSNSRKVVHLPYAKKMGEEFAKKLQKHCKKVVLRGF